MTEPLHYFTIAEAARLIARREVSPVELTRAHLERIDALDGGLKAYVTVTADAALAEARTAEREVAAGNHRGPLHGVPLAYKDLFDTAGVRTTAGSKVWADRVPDADATVVARLRDAGAVMLGKLALSEFAAGAVKTYVAPAPVNSWAPDRFTGASSSGSGVAVAAGLAMGALGSDTGGSIRGPAVCCGIFGLKPTYGLLSRSGVAALSWTLDHAGPMTRTAEDAALMLAAMAGRDPADATTVDLPSSDDPARIGEPIAGLRVRAKFMREFADLTQRVYLVMSPVFNEPAPLLTAEGDPVTWIAKMLADLGPATVDWTSPYNLLGVPAASVPCGFTDDGVPLGFQLAGRRLDDETVLRAAHAYQQTTTSHTCRPIP